MTDEDDPTPPQTPASETVEELRSRIALLTITRLLPKLLQVDQVEHQQKARARRSNADTELTLLAIEAAVLARTRGDALRAALDVLDAVMGTPAAPRGDAT